MRAIVDVYQYILQPLSPFSFFGLPVTTLDVVAALRLCIGMRQMREEQHRRYLATPGSSRKSTEDSSFMRSLMATLLIVYGGEAITGSWAVFSCSTFTEALHIVDSTIPRIPPIFHGFCYISSTLHNFASHRRVYSISAIAHGCQRDTTRSCRRNKPCLSALQLNTTPRYR